MTPQALSALPLFIPCILLCIASVRETKGGGIAVSWPNHNRFDLRVEKQCKTSRRIWSRRVAFIAQNLLFAGHLLSGIPLVFKYLKSWITTWMSQLNLYMDIQFPLFLSLGLRLRSPVQGSSKCPHTWAFDCHAKSRLDTRLKVPKPNIVHLFVCHNPSSQDCGAVQVRPGNARRHQKAAGHSAGYTCPACGKYFGNSREDSIRRHVDSGVCQESGHLRRYADMNVWNALLVRTRLCNCFIALLLPHTLSVSYVFFCFEA